MWFNNFGRVPPCEASINGWKDPKPASETLSGCNGWKDSRQMRTCFASCNGHSFIPKS